MPSEAFHAHGSTLEIYDGTQFIPIIELSVIGMNFSADELDLTHHESLDAWREYARGLKSAEVLLEGNLIIDNASHGFDETYGLGFLFDAKTFAILRIRFREGDPLTFTALLPEYTWVNDVEDAIRFSGRFRVSGIVTEAELFVLLWSEDFNYAPFDFGEFVLQYTDTWDYDQGKTWILAYFDDWDYGQDKTWTLEYFDSWDYGTTTETSRYIETWEPPTYTSTSQYLETWEYEGSWSSAYIESWNNTMTIPSGTSQYIETWES
jgi:predicted secreted protein